MDRKIVSNFVFIRPRRLTILWNRVVKVNVKQKCSLLLLPEEDLHMPVAKTADLTHHDEPVFINIFFENVLALIHDAHTIAEIKHKPPNINWNDVLNAHQSTTRSRSYSILQNTKIAISLFLLLPGHNIYHKIVLPLYPFFRHQY